MATCQVSLLALFLEMFANVENFLQDPVAKAAVPRQLAIGRYGADWSTTTSSLFQSSAGKAIVETPSCKGTGENESDCKNGSNSENLVGGCSSTFALYDLCKGISPIDTRR